MKKPVVYISGPMTGYEDFNRAAFNSAEKFIKGWGVYNVMNPAILPDGLTQAQYMDICLSMLRCCDQIYMLNGYQKSDGALCELAYAKKLGLKVVYQ